MKSRILLNLVLLLIVTGLGLFVYLKPKPASQAEFPLTDLTAASVQQIRIEKKGQPPTELNRRGNAWFITSPFKGRADTPKIDQILSIVKAHSAQRFAATDLGRFDLDKPLLTLTLNQQVFQFGTINPLSQEQYIATSNAVYLLPTHYFAKILAQPADFASKKILAEDEIPTGFLFSDRKLTRVEGKWLMVPPNDKSGQDQLNAFADQWRMASALLSEPYDERKSLGEFTLRFADGKLVPIKILQFKPELILLRTDENLQYHFPEEMAQRLLNFNANAVRPQK